MARSITLNPKSSPQPWSLLVNLNFQSSISCHNLCSWGWSVVDMREPIGIYYGITCCWGITYECDFVWYELSILLQFRRQDRHVFSCLNETRFSGCIMLCVVIKWSDKKPRFPVIIWRKQTNSMPPLHSIISACASVFFWFCICIP